MLLALTIWTNNMKKYVAYNQSAIYKSQTEKELCNDAKQNPLQATVNM